MASTGFHAQSSAENLNHDTLSSKKTAKLFDKQDSNVIRKSLQTLQPSSTNDKELVGKDGPVKQKPNKTMKALGSGKPPKKKTMIKQCFKPVEVYTDSSPEVAKNGNRSAEQEAFDLMGNEVVPESYWKMLAEERRSALDDSLHENEQLYKEIDDLKDENSKLKELAGQADYLASILQTAIESSSDEEETVDGSVTDEKVESFLSSCEVISLTDENVQRILSDEPEPCQSAPISDLDNVVQAKVNGKSSFSFSVDSNEENELRKSNESSKTIQNGVFIFVGNSPDKTSSPSETCTADS